MQDEEEWERLQAELSAPIPQFSRAESVERRTADDEMAAFRAAAAALGD